MKYFSMFSGIGGFEYGIEKAIGSEAECIGYSEVDKYAIQTYEKHFQHKNYGDATKINPSELPDFDMLCGGFPCQAFSIAGKRRGFEEARGTLFFDIARILKVKRPKIVFLENVKGLLNHEKGKTFKVIIQTLSELGYDVQWMVLNSKFHGVPQNRERVFIIGNLRGEGRPEVLPLRQIEEWFNEENKERGENAQIARTVLAQYYKSPPDANYILQVNEPTHSNDRVYSDEGISPTLNSMQGGQRQPKVLCVDDGASPKYQNEMVEQSPALKATRSNYKLTTESAVRRLTPLECERLQGFPDNWTEGVSNTQRYKQCGNAVTTKVITAIMRKMEEKDE
jgi:DNA (cytosine-5)-methyltransferase 1